MPEVPTLLYIGRRGRVTERAIGLTNCVPSLLQQIYPHYHPDTPVSVSLISMLVDRLALVGLLLGGCQVIAWW
jgi:hypothetical protein